MLSRRLLLALPLASGLKGQKPETSSFDFSLLESSVIPADLFFVHEHFPVPRVSSAGWKLSFSGAVANPQSLAFDDVVEQPHKMVPVTLEAAENPSGGGLISHGEWSGVSLASLVKQAQPKPDARFIRLLGADGYSHSIPIAKALHPDTLIAYQMNGEKLPVKHGFPLRAIVPGWYGMNSVKWLRSVEVLTEDVPEHEYQRSVQSLLAGRQSIGPVTAMKVKSAFSRPVDGAILTKRHFIIRGAAWAGESRVREVEVSTDGGGSWARARLASDTRPYGWVFWSYDWKIASAGDYRLAVRATNEVGERQPSERPPERVDGYELNTVQKIQVIVS